MTWFRKKRQQFAEDMVTDAVGALQSHTQKTVLDGKKRLEQLLPMISFAIMIFGDLNVGFPKSKIASPNSLGSNFTVYIESVNVTLHNN